MPNYSFDILPQKLFAYIMYFLIVNPFVWKTIFSQEFILFSFELCVLFIVYVTCFCHVFLFLIVIKCLICVYRVHASNKGHGLRVKLYHTTILIYCVLGSSLSACVGIISTVILIAAIKDSSNLQSRHVVRVCVKRNPSFVSCGWFRL